MPPRDLAKITPVLSICPPCCNVDLSCHNMDVVANVWPNPISFLSLFWLYKIRKLGLLGGEFVEAKREVHLGGNTIGQKILKKNKRKIGREEGLQSKSNLFILLFSTFPHLLWFYFFPP